ncbi:MAG: DUF2892 domain-containing protein [Actinomycetales bacterium]|nr:DUF2892 domain-containing protein [Actinomycetales bacterium]
MSFIQFMGSNAGRWVRAVVGLGLLGWGILLGVNAWPLMLVGVVVAAAGIFDFCLFAPFAKRPMNGKKLRASYQGPAATTNS